MSCFDSMWLTKSCLPADSRSGSQSIHLIQIFSPFWIHPCWCRFLISEYASRHSRSKCDIFRFCWWVTIYSDMVVIQSKSDSNVSENFCQIKIFSCLVRKKTNNHLFLWCLKLKINEFWNCKICFLKKQADSKANCTRLWGFGLMITYNMLSQKYYFC